MVSVQYVAILSATLFLFLVIQVQDFSLPDLMRSNLNSALSLQNGSVGVESPGHRPQLLKQASLTAPSSKSEVQYSPTRMASISLDWFFKSHLQFFVLSRFLSWKVKESSSTHGVSQASQERGHKNLTLFLPQYWAILEDVFLEFLVSHAQDTSLLTMSRVKVPVVLSAQTSSGAVGASVGAIVGAEVGAEVGCLKEKKKKVRKGWLEFPCCEVVPKSTRTYTRSRRCSWWSLTAIITWVVSGTCRTRTFLSIFDCFKRIFTSADTDAIFYLTFSIEFTIYAITNAWVRNRVRCWGSTRNWNCRNFTTRRIRHRLNRSSTLTLNGTWGRICVYSILRRSKSCRCCCCPRISLQESGRYHF